MQLTPVNYNFDSYKTNTTAFRGYTTIAEPLIEDFSKDVFLTTKSSRLLKKVEVLFDETWQEYKSKKLKSIPEFKHIRRDSNVTLKPIYYGKQNEILLNIDRGEEIERVTIPRERHNSYKYEKIKRTPYGTATLKTYNSNIQKDEAMDSRINMLLEEYLADFFKNRRGNVIY